MWGSGVGSSVQMRAPGGGLEREMGVSGADL